MIATSYHQRARKSHFPTPPIGRPPGRSIMGGGSGVVMTIGQDGSSGDETVVRTRRWVALRGGADSAGSDRDAAAPETAEQFSLWVGPHWRGMSILARRLTPSDEWEDVLQESLGAAWRKRRQFDPDRGSARNWLLAITADQAHKSGRRRVPEPVAEPEESVAVDRARDLDLERAVAGLTERQQLAVTLYYFLGLPVADVADVMACTEGTVKSTLRDSRTKMRGLLGEDYR